MSRLSAERVALAREIMARFPDPRSALVPLVHLAQEQDGYVTEDAMEHVGELIGATPAEVFGTASFYGMFKFHPVGRYVVDVCTNIACLRAGADDLLAHCDRSLGVRAGGTTGDGMFTLEDVECIAACTVAPCIQVNYRYFANQTPASFDELVDDLRAGKFEADVPPHGVLARVRQQVAPDRWAGTGTAPPPTADVAPGPALGASSSSPSSSPSSSSSGAPPSTPPSPGAGGAPPPSPPSPGAGPRPRRRR
jgi:NADH-quinone oxidoreductase subunit E